MYAKAAWIIPLLPLAAFLLQIALGKSYGKLAPAIGITAYLSAFAMSLLVLLERLARQSVDYNYSFDWITLGDYRLRIGFEVSALNASILFVLTMIVLLTGVLSAVTMKNDERLNTWYSYMSLFAFGITGVVLSDNLLTYFMLLELASVGALLLASFRYWQNGAKDILLKSFVSTRIGSAALVAAMLLLFSYMPDHAMDFATIESVFEGRGGMLATGIATSIAFLILLGASGYAGQFPLHGWFPEALRGPAPAVSSIAILLTGAAGVFLIARTFDLFQASPSAMAALIWIGGGTALISALFAIAQRDYWRLLAYGLISQLGHMLCAFGLGVQAEGLLLLLSFLLYGVLLLFAIAAGSSTPVAAIGAVIGGAGLSGILPSAGYQTRGALLSAALTYHPLLFLCLLVAGMGVAYALTSLLLRLFGRSGDERKHEVSLDGKRSRITMLPVVLLSVLALGASLLAAGAREDAILWLAPFSSLQTAGWIVAAAVPLAALIGCYASWRTRGTNGTIGTSGTNGTAAGIPKGDPPWMRFMLSVEYRLDKLLTALPAVMLNGLKLLLHAVERGLIHGTGSLAARGVQSAGRFAAAGLRNGKTIWGLIALALLALALIAVAGKGILL